MNKKRRVLILGGSSDIGLEVVENFLQLKWEVTAHFFKSKKKIRNIAKKFKKFKNYQV